MVEVSTYTVKAQRSGKYWHLEVPEIDRSTQARHLGEVDTMSRELISIITDEAEDTIDLNVEIEIGDEAKKARRAAEELQLEASQKRARAAEKNREVARILQSQGMPIRDIATILGVSRQRVSQLLTSSQKNPRKRPATV